MLVPLLLAAIVAQPTVFRLDPAGAEAGFDLAATMHTVHGTTTKLSGEVRVVPEDDGSLALSGRIEVDAASLDTGNKKRDATLRGETLEVATYLAIVLTPERFTPAAPAKYLRQTEVSTRTGLTVVAAAPGGGTDPAHRAPSGAYAPPAPAATAAPSR